jgi:hypothetical protein
MPPEIPDLPDDHDLGETQANHTTRWWAPLLTGIMFGILIGLAWGDAWDAIRSIHP